MSAYKVSSAAMRETLKRYVAELKKYKRYFIPAFILPGIGSIFSLYLPALVVSRLLNGYQKHQNFSQQKLIMYVSVFAAVWLFGELLWRTSEWFNEQGQHRGLRDLYTQAIGELLKRDIGFFNDNFAGSLTKRALDYAKGFEDFADKLGKNLFNFVITFCFSFIILWKFSPWLSLALLVAFFVTLKGSLYFLKKRMHIVYLRNAASNRAAGVLADIIANVNVVKTFGREQQEYQHYKDRVDEHVDLSLKSWKTWNERHDAFVSPMYVGTNVLGLILAIYFGQKYGLSSAAIFIAFVYIGRITRSLWELGPLYIQLERLLGDAAEHVQAVMDEPLVVDVPDAKNLEIKKGEIKFDGVRFVYEDNKASELFDSFNLAIEPGEKIGLVGHSGGGKTTVTKLLLRFMDIQAGTISIDGQDISKVKQRGLRQAIAYVPQEPMLFHRTLAENIGYGTASPKESDIIKVSKLAHADDFIHDFPKGYETLVGERGVKLSGGQRQRVAIARAMLKDAPILLLDEATSALDSESEVLIQDALWKLMEGRTAIVIAHRLSTIQKMDRIVVLDNGKIVEQGTHAELIKAKGTYAGLWAHQSGGFLED